MRKALVLMLLWGCGDQVNGGTGGGAGGGSGGSTGGSGGAATGGGTGGSGGSGGAATGGGTGGSAGGATAGGSAGGSAGSGGSGGAGGTGGSAGSGGSGGATDGGCSWRFCDDFERYDAGRAPSGPWTVSTNGGTVTIGSAHVHGGQNAVHVTNAGAAAYEQAYFGVKGAFFPVPGNQFYGRAWFYVTAVDSATNHWTNISGEGKVPDAGTNVTAYVRYGGQIMKHIMANYDTTNVATDCYQHSTTPMPAGTWNCYEWHFDQPNNRMELWLDGTQLTSVTINGTGQGCVNNGLNGKWLLPQFDTLRLGWEHYQTSIPIDMWIDDVALDTRKIGCGP
jgi:hypothetical protein